MSRSPRSQSENDADSVVDGAILIPTFNQPRRVRIGRGVVTTGRGRQEIWPDPDFQAWREIKAERHRPKTDGATWEAGVTKDSDRYRVLLNGEPVPGAIAASYKFGWVDYIYTHTPWDSAEFVTERRRLHGYVQIIADLFQ